MVKINGEETNAAGMTVAQYLAGADYDTARVVVELNGRILPKAQYSQTVLADGDTAEIVSFVGGG